MNKDIRIKTTFPRHPKTIKLYRKLGPEGPLCLLYLWLWAAENRPSGNLNGLDAWSIATACAWPGEADVFVGTLLEVGYLEKLGEHYVLHDWSYHNAYAAAAVQRSEKASKAAKVRWERKLGLCSEHCGNGKKPDAPSPNPSPSPKDKRKKIIKRKKKFEPPTFEEVKAYCEERKNGIDPQHFLDSNTAKGWVVGKNKTPMVDWKAAVRTWERNADGKTKQTGQSAPKGKYADHKGVEVENA